MMVSMMPMLTVKEMKIIMMTTFLILILITAMMRLKHWLGKKTSYIKSDSINFVYMATGEF